MKRSAGRTLIAETGADGFVGRETEIARLLNHAEGFGSANGLALLSAPWSGASELLRQVYDHLFYEQKDIVPIYFAIKKSDATANASARRLAREFLIQLAAFRAADAGILVAPPRIEELIGLTAHQDEIWMARTV